MLDLQSYEIDVVRGFLPSQDPLEQLPPHFNVWEEMSSLIPGLLTAGKARQLIDQMKTVDPVSLEGRSQLMRAFLLLSVIANAYIMGEAEQATVLPRQLALPLYTVAKRLGLPPVFTYASMIMNNWTRIDKTGPVELDNLMVQRSYLGYMDEHWFYLCMTVIEAKGAAAIKAVAWAQSAMVNRDNDGVANSLKAIITALGEMLATLNRLPEKCDPYIFYHRIRPILAAWKQPVIYEGISDKPEMWIAASAAQSTLFHALDIALGISHHASAGTFLHTMRDYMPHGHRRFLTKLEDSFSLRQYVLAHRQSVSVLEELYNESIHHLDSFRKRHIEITVRYLVQQGHGEQLAYGTSGTEFVHFLGQVRKETTAQSI